MKYKIEFLLILLFVATPFLISAQNRKPSELTRYHSRDSISKGGYTLICINKDSLFSDEVKRNLEETFFTVYPRMVKRFNKDANRKVIFVIEPKYDGVAGTSNGKVVFSPNWFRKHPKDIDVVTHEVMHIIQAYGNTSGPGWVTEGIADYVRFIYGVNNAGADWTLPEVKKEQSYTNAYRVTARFFVWLQKNKNKRIIDKLDLAMRNNTYNAEIWKELTGKSIDDLWTEYVGNPKI